MMNEINIQDEDTAYIHKNSELSLISSKIVATDCEVDSPKSSINSVNYDKCKSLLEVMKHEKNRLSSFEGKWPLEFINYIDLSKLGFFYLQLDDRVQCAFCGIVVDNWNDGDIPLKLHIRKSPKCPFLVTSTKNLPVIHSNPAPLNYCNKLAPLPSASNSYRPKNPQMCDIKRRISTFKGWPLTMITPEELADCGLYYTGVADVVTCFFCGGSLGSWEPFDDPLTEHSKFYPNCAFLKLLCSRPVQKKRNVMRPFNAGMQNPEQPIKQALTSELMKSEVIQQAKEIFPTWLVHDVVLQHLKQTGKSFTSLNQLCEKILERDRNRLVARMLSEEKHKQSSAISSCSENPETKSANNEIPVKNPFLCKICMEGEMGIVFQPCGHLVTCEKCAELISECPLCRRSIETRIRTYVG